MFNFLNMIPILLLAKRRLTKKLTAIIASSSVIILILLLANKKDFLTPKKGPSTKNLTKRMWRSCISGETKTFWGSKKIPVWGSVEIVVLLLANKSRQKMEPKKWPLNKYFYNQENVTYLYVLVLLVKEKVVLGPFKHMSFFPHEWFDETVILLLANNSRQMRPQKKWHPSTKSKRMWRTCTTGETNRRVRTL